MRMIRGLYVWFLMVFTMFTVISCGDDYVPAPNRDAPDMSSGQCMSADDCDVLPNKRCFGANATVTYAAYARCLEGEGGNYCKFYDSPLLNCPNGCDPMTGLCKDK